MTDEERERREAEALARVLEDAPSSGADAVPRDALETAALLRYARDGGALAGAREAAVLARVLRDAPQPVDTRRSSGALSRWLFGGGVGLAAAAALLVVLIGRAPAPTPLPPAPVSLLAAEAEAARPGGGPLASLVAEVAPYRAVVGARLAARYGAK